MAAVQRTAVVQSVPEQVPCTGGFAADCSLAGPELKI